MNKAKLLTTCGYVFAALGCAAALAATGHTVTQKGKAFSADSMTIAAGDSITFKNNDSVKHNILIKDIDFNSGTQEPGQEAVAKFANAGEFKVRCGIHPKMKMTVTVQ